MKRVLYLAVSSCLLVLLTVTAFAQLEGAPIRANIPFSFEVRGHTLPAGEYEISRVNSDGSGLNITNVDHRHQHAIVETDPVQSTRRNRGELVFHRYGDSYFLYEIWTPGMETGRVLPTSREEKTLRRDLNVAANTVETQTVAVAIY